MARFDRGGAIAASLGNGKQSPPLSVAREVDPRLEGVSNSDLVVQLITRDRIEPDPDQHRKLFKPEAIEDLAASIRKRGIMVPIEVAWNEDRQKYKIISGQRRWMAAGVAGVESVPCLVCQDTPRDLLERQITDNLLREQLAPMEEARAFRDLAERRGWNQTQLCAELGVSMAKVSRAYSLLKLDTDVAVYVEEGIINGSDAYEISRAPLIHQGVIAEQVISEHFSREQIRALVNEYLGRDPNEEIQRRKSSAGKAPLSSLAPASSRPAKTAEPDLAPPPEGWLEGKRGLASKSDPSGLLNLPPVTQVAPGVSIVRTTPPEGPRYDDPATSRTPEADELHPIDRHLDRVKRPEATTIAKDARPDGWSGPEQMGDWFEWIYVNRSKGSAVKIRLGMSTEDDLVEALEEALFQAVRKLEKGD